MNTIRRLMLALAASTLASSAFAQAWPAKPIRLVVPFPPGGGTDTIAREVSQRVAAVTGMGTPHKSVADVVAAAKARPGQLNFASPGNGTVAHLTSELFQKAAGIDTQHVPYKGAAQALTDVISGNVDLYMASVPTLIGQIRNGKLRALAVTSARRVDDLPSVATINESGFKGFDEVTWFGLLAPAGTPRDVVARLNAEFNKALQNPELRRRLGDEGADAVGGTPEQFAALIRDEIPRWGRVVRESGARVD